MSAPLTTSWQDNTSGLTIVRFRVTSVCPFYLFALCSTLLFFFSFRRLFRGKSAVLENFPNTGCIVLMVSGECQKRWEIIFLFDSSLVFLSLSVSLSLCALFHNLSVTSEILFLLFCTLCIETTLNEVLWESRNLFLLCIKLCSLFIPQKTRKDWVCFDGTELANNDRPALLHVPR